MDVLVHMISDKFSPYRWACVSDLDIRNLTEAQAIAIYHSTLPWHLSWRMDWWDLRRPK
ncbi:MAG: hypothetical protein ACRD4C_10985 [Candidatus Acidiferrales bacterium]